MPDAGLKLKTAPRVKPEVKADQNSSGQFWAKPAA
jgi:hypothetical protein